MARSTWVRQRAQHAPGVRARQRIRQRHQPVQRAAAAAAPPGGPAGERGRLGRSLSAGCDGLAAPGTTPSRRSQRGGCPPTNAEPGSVADRRSGGSLAGQCPRAAASSCVTEMRRGETAMRTTDPTPSVGHDGLCRHCRHPYSLRAVEAPPAAPRPRPQSAAPSAGASASAGSANQSRSPSSSVRWAPGVTQEAVHALYEQIGQFEAKYPWITVEPEEYNWTAPTSRRRSPPAPCRTFHDPVHRRQGADRQRADRRHRRARSRVGYADKFNPNVLVNGQDAVAKSSPCPPPRTACH